MLRGLKFIFEKNLVLDSFFGVRRSRQDLARVVVVFREIEDRLVSGVVPDRQCWDRLKELQRPWGRLASESLGELKESGGALLPTLQRLRGLAEEQAVALEDAQAKTAQAIAQSLVCALLVPLVGGALYVVLPGIQEKAKVWFGACLVALLFMTHGMMWMLRVAELARWGGLALGHRPWILSAYCAGERFLALVRLGLPADLAWIKTTRFLESETPDLAKAWGVTVWVQPGERCVNGRPEALLVAAGHSIRSAAHASLVEGRPCLDRIEVVLRTLRANLRSQVDRELSLAGTRALAPLFLCVAPSILGLLFFALWMIGLDAMGDLNVGQISF